MTEHQSDLYIVVELKRNGEPTGNKAGPFPKREAEIMKMTLQTIYRRRFRVEPQPRQQEERK